MIAITPLCVTGRDHVWVTTGIEWSWNYPRYEQHYCAVCGAVKWVVVAKPEKEEQA